MTRRRTAIIASLAVSLTACGTHTTRPVQSAQVTRLARGPHTREIVVRAKNGRETRIGPNSRIRFQRRDGRWTAWISGRRLHADTTGVYWRQSRRSSLTGYPWADIRQAEVKNVSGGKVYGAIVATVVITAALITVTAGIALATGGKGRMNGLGRLFELPLRAVWAKRRSRRHEARPFPQSETASHSGTAGPPPVQTLDVPRSQVPRSFVKQVRRRAIFRFIGGLEGGTDLLLLDGMSTGAWLGMRLFDIIELAGGARLLMHPRPANAQQLRGSWMGFFRLVAHLDLDARRRFALPIGIDAGGGQPAGYLRFVLGMRFRLHRHLSLGVYPFNPTYTDFKDETQQRGQRGWTFPTTVDLAFTY